jgi:UDP-glucose 4-epimerase
MIVTGNAGFIGGHLIRTLEAEGADVVGVDLKEGKDIRDTELMKRSFRGGNFHLAALPRVPYSIEHPRETHDHNVDGTLSVLYYLLRITQESSALFTRPQAPRMATRRFCH